MKVEGALGAVELFALLVRALVLPLDVVGAAPVVLLASRAVPLRLQSVQILIVEALYFECLH